MNPGAGLERLSLNTATVRGTDLLGMVDACAWAGIPWIAPWRHLLQEVPAERAARAIREAGMRVSSLCRGGFFPAATEAERQERLEDCRRAIDEAATLGAEVLVLVCGGVVDKDIRGSRQMVEDGIAAVAPYAAERGVKLGIEPLHPMFAADRSVVVTLRQANEMAIRIASGSGSAAGTVGVVVDVYHVWWDPSLEDAIEASRGRVVGFHVNDWIVPLPDVLEGRGMMGDGCIELGRLRRAVDAVGYDGPIEVEIFHQGWWAKPVDEVLATMVKRYREVVLEQGG
jgi:sugar phosphate isomerase/epimerase